MATPLSVEEIESFVWTPVVVTTLLGFLVLGEILNILF